MSVVVVMSLIVLFDNITKKTVSLFCNVFVLSIYILFILLKY